MARLPCATLLVRLATASRSADGLRVLGADDVKPSERVGAGVVLPPPPYDEGVCVDRHRFRFRTRTRIAAWYPQS